jgi:hypothetical protein
MSTRTILLSVENRRITVPPVKIIESSSCPAEDESAAHEREIAKLDAEAELRRVADRRQELASSRAELNARVHAGEEEAFWKTEVDARIREVEDEEVALRLLAQEKARIAARSAASGQCPQLSALRPPPH